jgi:L-amino acid N-acyltransferase YncA
LSTRPSSATDAVLIRASRAADVKSIAEIYGFHVLNGSASFELLAPSTEEMAERRADVLRNKFPYLVAELGGRVVGFAYANFYRTRPAYRHTLEDSIYLHKDFGGRGIGRTLLDALLIASEDAGCRQMIAVIGDSANAGSIKLHAACGFRRVGTMKAVGFKFGRWVDSVIMQRAMGEGAKTLPGEPGAAKSAVKPATKSGETQ